MGRGDDGGVRFHDEGFWHLLKAGKPRPLTDAEKDENVGCLKASITAAAVSALGLVLLIVAISVFDLPVGVSLDGPIAAVLTSLAIGVVLGVRSEHLHGVAWFKVGAGTLLLACPIYFVIVFLLVFEGISGEEALVVLAVLSLPFWLKAARWLRAVRNAAP